MRMVLAKHTIFLFFCYNMIFLRATGGPNRHKILVGKWETLSPIEWSGLEWAEVLLRMNPIGSLELVPCTACRRKRKRKKLQRQKQTEKRGSQITIAKTCTEPHRIGSHRDQDVKHSSISSNCGRCELMGSRHRNDIALHLLRHWHRHRHRRLCPRRRLVSTTLFPFHFILFL